MSVSFYDTLGVARTAGPDFIEAAYQLSHKRLRERLDRGDSSARAELTVLDEAYTVLTTPERKAAYDVKIAQQDRVITPVTSSRQEPLVYEHGSSKLSWLVAGLLLLGKVCVT